MVDDDWDDEPSSKEKQEKAKSINDLKARAAIFPQSSPSPQARSAEAAGKKIFSAGKPIQKTNDEIMRENIRLTKILNEKSEALVSEISQSDEFKLKKDIQDNTKEIQKLQTNIQKNMDLLFAKEIEPEKPAPSTADRGGLLAQIQQGKKLKSAAATPGAEVVKPSGSSREGLLQELKSRAQQKKASTTSPLDAEAVAKRKADNERLKAMALKASFDNLEKAKKKYGDLLAEAEGLKKIITTNNGNVPNAYQVQLEAQNGLIANLTHTENQIKDLIEKRKTKEQALKKQEAAQLQALANSEVSAAPFEAPPMGDIPIAPPMDGAVPPAPPMGDIPVAPPMDNAVPPAPPMDDIPLAPPMDSAVPPAPPMDDIPLAPPMDSTVPPAPPMGDTPIAPPMNSSPFSTKEKANIATKPVVSQAPAPTPSTPAAPEVGFNQNTIRAQGAMAAERNKEKIRLNKISEILLDPSHALHEDLMNLPFMQNLEETINEIKAAAVREYQASLDPKKDARLIKDLARRIQIGDDPIEEIWDNLARKDKKYKAALLETTSGIVNQHKEELSSLYNAWSKKEEERKIEEAKAKDIALQKKKADDEKKLAEARNKALADANIILNPDEKRVNDFVQGLRTTAASAISEGEIFLAEMEKKINAAKEVIVAIPDVQNTPDPAPAAVVAPSSKVATEPQPEIPAIEAQADIPVIEPQADTPVVEPSLTADRVAPVSADDTSPSISDTLTPNAARISDVHPDSIAKTPHVVATAVVPPIAPTQKNPTNIQTEASGVATEMPITPAAISASFTATPPSPKIFSQTSGINSNHLPPTPSYPIQSVSQAHNKQKTPQTIAKLGWTKELENQLQLQPLFSNLNSYIKSKEHKWNLVMLLGVDQEKKVNNAIKLKTELASIMLKVAKEQTDPLTGKLQENAIENIKDKMIIRLQEEVKKDHAVIESSVWGRKGVYSNFLIQALDELEPNNKYSSSPDNPWNKGMQINPKPRH